MTMDVQKTINGTELLVKISGFLNSQTASSFENELLPAMEGMTNLILDFSELDFISSAGLRVLFKAYDKMPGKGNVVVKGANKDVREVFTITKLNELLAVE